MVTFVFMNPLWTRGGRGLAAWLAAGSCLSFPPMEFLVKITRPQFFSQKEKKCINVIESVVDHHELASHL